MKDKPRELGGEIELWLEDEKYIITKSTMVYIPKGIMHCPVIVRKIDSPIAFFSAANNVEAYTKIIDGEKSGSGRITDIRNTAIKCTSDYASEQLTRQMK